MDGRMLRDVPSDVLALVMHSTFSPRARKTGEGLFRVITMVPVCRSAERMFRVAVTFPLRSVNRVSEAALAAAPSRTPSASRLITLRTTIVEMVLAPRPEVCPSARTIDTPPLGLSTTSSVSPLSEVAYLFTLAIPIWISIKKILLQIVKETSEGWMKLKRGMVY